VAVLKGDVNGTWAAPEGSTRVSDVYYYGLATSNPLTVQVTQFGLPVIG
jgi:hypothetical protein